MINFTDCENMEDLTYEEQVIIATLEILDRITHGKESYAKVSYVLHDLFAAIPWQGLNLDNVNPIVDQVAHYGISSLPGYVEAKDE